MIIGQLQRCIQRRLVIAGVVLESDGRLIGKRLRRNEVAPPDLHWTHSQLPGRLAHQALHDVRRLRPPGAPIGVDGDRVREHTLDLAVNSRSGVRTRQERAVEPGGNGGRERRQVGTEVGLRIHPQAEELAVGIEGEPRVGNVVATVSITHERLAALGRPFHRPPELARRPGDDHLLGIVKDLGPEPTTHIGRHLAQLVLGNAHDEGAHQQPDDVWVLSRGIQGVLTGGGMVLADPRPRLDGIGNDPVINELDFGHVSGARERGLGGRLVTDLPVEADIALGLVPHLRSPRFQRCRDPPHRRQLLLLHFHQLRRVFRLGRRLGDDHRHLIPHVTSAVDHHGRMGRLHHGGTVLTGDPPAAGHPTEARRGQVLPGVDSHHARAGCSRGRVYGGDSRVGIGRTHHAGEGLAGPVDIIGVGALPRQETEILFAAHRGADALLTHLPLPAWLPLRR